MTKLLSSSPVSSSAVLLVCYGVSSRMRMSYSLTSRPSTLCTCVGGQN